MFLENKALQLTLDWLYGVEVVLHALDLRRQLIDSVDDDRKVLQNEATRSVGKLRSILVVRWDIDICMSAYRNSSMS
jgi:hypothetical protein